MGIGSTRGTVRLMRDDKGAWLASHRVNKSSDHPILETNVALPIPCLWDASGVKGGGQRALQGPETPLVTRVVGACCAVWSTPYFVTLFLRFHSASAETIPADIGACLAVRGVNEALKRLGTCNNDLPVLLLPRGTEKNPASSAVNTAHLRRSQQMVHRRARSTSAARLRSGVAWDAIQYRE